MIASAILRCIFSLPVDMMTWSLGSLQYDFLLPPLMVAHWGNPIELKRKQTEGKALLEARNAGGRTPLHLATAFASIDCVRALLEMGANATTIDKKKRTICYFTSIWARGCGV